MTVSLKLQRTLKFQRNVKTWRLDHGKTNAWARSIYFKEPSGQYLLKVIDELKETGNYNL